MDVIKRLSEEKLLNSLYVAIEDHVIVENSMFSVKGDLFNELLTLLALNEKNKKISKQKFQSFCKKLESKIGQGPILTYIKEAYLLSVFRSQFGYKSKFLKKILSSHLLNNLKASRLSSNAKGFIAYCILSGKNMSYSERNYISFVTSKFNESLNQQNIEKAVDYGIGVLKINKNRIEEFSRLVQCSREDLGLERLSKAILFMNRNKQTPLWLINLLEQRIRKELSLLKSPEIEFSLFQAHKLVNSNIPPQHLSKVLKTLKPIKPDWSKWIEKIEKDGVFINLRQFSKLPSFSPNDDVWTLIAMTETNRKYSYQLSQDDYKNYLELKRDDDSGFRSFKFISIVILVVFAVVLTLMVVYLFQMKGGSWNELLDLNIDPDTPRDIGSTIITYLFNPWANLFVNMAWIFIFISRFNKKGRVNFMDFITTWPLMFIIMKFIPNKRNR